MITSEVTFEDDFGLVSEQIELLAVRAVAAATRAAAIAADAASTTINLELEIVEAVPTEGGYQGGIKSRKRGSKSNVRLAPIFDGGSLGKRRRKLARSDSSAGGEHGRREEWEVTRGGSTYTAHRHELDSSMGIKPQNFFAKGKRAGREAMYAELEHHH